METLEYTNFQVWSYSILGGLSVSSGALLIWSYLKVPTLRTKLGLTVLWTCMALMCLCFYFVYSAFSYLATERLHSAGTCFLHGIVTSCLTLVSWNYALVLALQVGLGWDTKYSHTFSIGFGALLSFALALTDSLGVSVFSVCFVKIGSWGELLFFVFIAYLPLYVFGVLKGVRKKSQKYSLILLVFTLFMLPFSVAHLVFYFNSTAFIVREVGALTISSSGLVLNLLRMTHINFKQLLKKSRNYDLTEPVFTT